MIREVIVPPQVRAGRALLGWSQEQLAKEAGVGLSTVRDTESERRAADTGSLASIRRALWNGGVVFTAGREGEGPGVRLVADRPNLIRRPTTIQRWEGMPFTVEWRGKLISVVLAFEVIEDLDNHYGDKPDEVYLETFDRHRGQLLDAVALAVANPENFDQQGRLIVQQEHLDALKAGAWYQVRTKASEDVRDVEARALMRKFAATFISAGIPPNVEVFHGQADDGAHIYYFSPSASSVAKELLTSFGAEACKTPPDFSALKRVRL